MSKCTEIRDICGDYAFDVEYHADNKFTMFFNSYRNAQTVKRCIEVDDSVPNVATAVDFVEVVRCKDCKYCHHRTIPNNERYECEYYGCSDEAVDYVEPTHYCSYGERRDNAIT